MDTRQLQINALLQNVTNITEKYNNVYEVLWFDPKVNRTLCLSITLPPQFPTAAPIFRVTPQISHPWLDVNGIVIGHKKLGSNWNQHVSLANVTNEIIKELKSSTPNIQQTYPGMGVNNPYYYGRPVPPPTTNPPPIPRPPYPYQNYQNMNMGPTPMSNNINNYMQNNNNDDNDIDINDLERLSLEELKEILNNENKRKEYINEKNKIKEMYNVKEEMTLSNKSLAEKSLSYKENFEKLKADLKEQQDILKAEKEKFESLMAEQSKFVSNYTPGQLYSSMNQATSEADRDSEEIANNFLMGSISADEFLKKYRTARKLYHLRNEKMELFSSNQESLFSKK